MALWFCFGVLGDGDWEDMMLLCSRFFFLIFRMVLLQHGLGAEIRWRFAGDISESSGVIYSYVAELSATSPVVAVDDERILICNIVALL